MRVMAITTPDEFDVDLGSGHWLRWTFRCQGEDSPRERIGALITHKNGDCWSQVMFSPYDDGPTWGFDGNLESPTFAPSILCRLCGDHGFIRQGEWVTA